MPSFKFNRGKMRSLESIAYLDAIERGETPSIPVASVQPAPRVRQTVTDDADLTDEDAIGEADGKPAGALTPAQKRAATMARNKAARAAAMAEPLRPQNIDPATGAVVELREVIDPETGEVKQVPVETEAAEGNDGAADGDGEAEPTETSATSTDEDASGSADDADEDGANAEADAQ